MKIHLKCLRYAPIKLTKNFVLTVWRSYYNAKVKIDIIKNKIVKTNVALKINFSNPLLVKDELPPPMLLDSPAVLDWIRIRRLRPTARKICKKSNMLFIQVLYNKILIYLTFNQPINKWCDKWKCKRVSDKCQDPFNMYGWNVQPLICYSGKWKRNDPEIFNDKGYQKKNNSWRYPAEKSVSDQV